MDRYLAIDYGTVRVGLALTDPLKITAQPLPYLANDQKLLPNLEQLIKEKAVSRIIIGYPIQLNGSEGPASQKVKEFAESLECKLPGLKIILADERMTTAQAEKILISADMRRDKRKAKIDSLAAALLLENYLRGEQR